MRNKLLQAGVALSAVMAVAGTASAQGEFSGNVALTTDYVWRGVSQSNEDIALQGGFDYENGMFYAGVWASSIDFRDDAGTNLEIDFYGGLAGELESGIGWDLGFIYYNYPDDGNEDLDFYELTGALSYEFDGGLGVGGSLAWDPDNKSIYVEASAGYSVTDYFSIDGTLGNFSFDEGGDYTNWSLGGTYSLEGFDIDLRYWGTDLDGEPLADDRVVLTLSRSF
ncbi:MAG: TorF family putative porin [Hyphomonas sp.]